MISFPSLMYIVSFVNYLPLKFLLIETFYHNAELVLSQCESFNLFRFLIQKIVPQLASVI